MDGIVVSIFKTLVGLAIIAAIMVGFNFAVFAITGMLSGNHAIDVTHLISWREYILGLILFIWGGFTAKKKYGG